MENLREVACTRFGDKVYILIHTGKIYYIVDCGVPNTRLYDQDDVRATASFLRHVTYEHDKIRLKK